MLTKFYNKMKQWLQFFIEKPSARGNWKWVPENGNDANTEANNQDAQMYLPYQLNYFSNSSKSSVSEDNNWHTARLIHLSNSLAKAYCPDSPAVPTSKANENN